MELSIIVPSYNEHRLKENLLAIQNQIQKLNISYEIIAISDGSTIYTESYQQELQHLSPNIHFYHYQTNKGKGGAIKYGFQQCTGNYVAYIDGDLELHPKSLLQFYKMMKEENRDAVVGSKHLKESKVHYPLLRKILSKAYQKLIKHYAGITQINDTQTGIKMFTRELLTQTLPKVKANKYGFDLELVATAQQLGFQKMVEAPVELNFFAHRKRHQPIRDIIHTIKVGAPLLKETIGILTRLKKERHFKQALKSSTIQSDK